MEKDIQKGDWFTIREERVAGLQTTADHPYQCEKVEKAGHNLKKIFFKDDEGCMDWHYRCSVKKYNKVEEITVMSPHVDVVLVNKSGPWFGDNKSVNNSVEIGNIYNTKGCEESSVSIEGVQTPMISLKGKPYRYPASSFMLASDYYSLKPIDNSSTENKNVEEKRKHFNEDELRILACWLDTLMAVHGYAYVKEYLTENKVITNKVLYDYLNAGEGTSEYMNVMCYLQFPKASMAAYLVLHFEKELLEKSISIDGGQGRTEPLVAVISCYNKKLSDNNNSVITKFVEGDLVYMKNHDHSHTYRGVKHGLLYVVRSLGNNNSVYLNEYATGNKIVCGQLISNIMRFKPKDYVGKYYEEGNDSISIVGHMNNSFNTMINGKPTVVDVGEVFSQFGESSNNIPKPENIDSNTTVKPGNVLNGSVMTNTLLGDKTVFLECVTSNVSWYTKNDVYIYENGTLIDDDGDRRSTFSSNVSFKVLSVVPSGIEPNNGRIPSLDFSSLEARVADLVADECIIDYKTSRKGYNEKQLEFLKLFNQTEKEKPMSDKTTIQVEVSTKAFDTVPAFNTFYGKPAEGMGEQKLFSLLKRIDADQQTLLALKTGESSKRVTKQIQELADARSHVIKAIDALPEGDDVS